MLGKVLILTLSLVENPHAENTGTTADIQNNLVLEDVAVLVDRVAVGTGTDIVFLYRKKKSKVRSIGL